MATLEPACPNCGEMMLDGRSHLSCQSRRERIASLERTVGEQADQIGGLTSELEREKAKQDRMSQNLMDMLGAHFCKRHSEEVRRLGFSAFYEREMAAGCSRCTIEQLAASQAEVVMLRLVLKKARTPSRFFPEKVSYCPVCDQGETVGELEHQPHEPDCIIGQALVALDAAAERVQVVDQVLRAAYLLISRAKGPNDLWDELGALRSKLDALAAFDAATAKETLTVEEVKGDGA